MHNREGDLFLTYTDRLHSCIRTAKKQISQ